MEQNVFSFEEKNLTDNEKRQIEIQNSRLVPSFKAEALEKDAKKNWDLFYKRNETRFFRDRHWTTREFKELLNDDGVFNTQRTILEVGCGVGNLIFPLIQENINFKVIACDLSSRAIDLLKSNLLYDEKKITAFQTDITTKDIYSKLDCDSLDLITLVFVLSAIHPDKFTITLENIFNLLKPGGVLLFRDYGLYDMAQLRFKAGHKIAENFYMRQDGTRSYYFSTKFVEELFSKVGFVTITNTYVHRRTVNKKENIDVPRIFVQGKFKKPER